MSTSGTAWFTPKPGEISSSRVTLDFDLRRADLYFRNLVVPDLGRVWFVRQLSWPLAAIALHGEFARRSASPPKPTAICHGIEALACKLEYRSHSRDTSNRILGTRAFGRDDDNPVWSFPRLSQAANYVRNTHRQSATRALQVEDGLGFAKGARFDVLELEPVGRLLADAFLDQRVGKGGTSLRSWLIHWIEGTRQITSGFTTLHQALSPEYPSEAECTRIRARLLETVSDNSLTRARLASALGRGATLPNIEEGVVSKLRAAGHHKQADEIVAARAFGAVLDRARDVVANLTRVVEPSRGERLANCLSDGRLKRAIESLQESSKQYLDKAEAITEKEATSGAFARSIANGDGLNVVRTLVDRSGNLLGLADGCVTRGTLFQRISETEEAAALGDGAASIEPDRTGRTFRIANFHSLLLDIESHVAPRARAPR